MGLQSHIFRGLLCGLIALAGLRGQAPKDWRPLGLKLKPGLSAWVLETDQPLKAFVVLVDTKSSGLELRPLVSSDPAGKEPLSSMARAAGALVAVNASPFKPRSKPAQVEGWLVLDGRTLQAPISSVKLREQRFSVARAALIWQKPQGVRLGWVRGVNHKAMELEQPIPNRNLKPARKLGPARPLLAVKHALAAGPMLIRQGKLAVTREQEVLFPGRDDRRARTAVGFKGRLVILMVVEARNKTSRGSTLLQLARLLRSWGARSAMNLDGGGSSTLVIANRLINQPAGRSTERPVPTGLGVFQAKTRR